MYMDTKTFNLYNCPEEANDPDRLVEIDEMIAPTISLLNKKGYPTYASCSGHLSVSCENKKNTFNCTQGTYIAFKCNMLKEFTYFKNISPDFLEAFSIEYEHNSGREVIDYSKKEGSCNYELQEASETSIIRISDKERNLLKVLYTYTNNATNNNTDESIIYYHFRNLVLYNTILYAWAQSLPNKNKRKRKCKKKKKYIKK